MSHLPGILYDIAQECGHACAYTLANKWGGLKFYVPKPRSLTPAHRLVRELGADAAYKLCEMYKGEYINIPLGPSLGPSKKSIILALAEDKGLSNREIARKANTTERYVRHILNAGKPQNQLSLF